MMLCNVHPAVTAAADNSAGSIKRLLRALQFTATMYLLVTLLEERDVKVINSDAVMDLQRQLRSELCVIDSYKTQYTTKKWRQGERDLGS